MTEREGNVDDRDLRLALRRLSEAVVVPEADPARRTGLMAAFDEAQQRRASVHSGRQYWYMAGLATAAALLMAVGLHPALTGRHGTPPGANQPPHQAFASDLRGVQPGSESPDEFVMVPGAATLPTMESGSLVRVDVPVAELPSLGLTPPQSNRTASVRADLIVAQDGLTRAARLVRTE
jgi:anti-sigma-K factor RskA